MNREIKFRFWVRSLNKVEGPHDMWWNYTEFLDQGDCDVMQYTGLKVKEVELFEGDLFQVANNKIYEIAYASEGEFNYEKHYATFVLREVFSKDEFPIDQWALENGEIIGNIYSNPELINNNLTK